MSDLLVEEDPLIKEKIDLLSLQYPDFASYELRRALTKNGTLFHLMNGMYTFV